MSDLEDGDDESDKELPKKQRMISMMLILISTHFSPVSHFYTP